MAPSSHLFPSISQLIWYYFPSPSRKSQRFLFLCDSIFKSSILWNSFSLLRNSFHLKKNFLSAHIVALRVKFQWWLCARSSSRSVPVYFQALDMCMRTGDHWSPSNIQSLREWSTTSLRGLWENRWLKKILTTSALTPRCRHRCVIVLIAIAVECRIPCLTHVNNCLS